MKDKRQGNDLKVAWSIFMQDGEPFRLDGKDVSLYLKNMFGRKELNDFVTTGNIIQWTFYGKDQKNTGKYSLELVINEGEKGMITTDKCDFVNLVSCSCKLQGGEDAPNVETESIELTSTLEYVAGGGDYDDTALWKELENKVDKVEGLGLSEENYTTEEKDKLAGLENYDDSELLYIIADLDNQVSARHEEIMDLQNSKADKSEVVTPDWNAREGEEGYIENKPFGDLLNTPITERYVFDFVSEEGDAPITYEYKTRLDSPELYIKYPYYCGYDDHKQFGYGVAKLDATNKFVVISDPNSFRIEAKIHIIPSQDEQGDDVYELHIRTYNYDNLESLYVFESGYNEILKPISDAFIPDTIARQAELTELSTQVSGLSEKVDSLEQGGKKEVFWAKYGKIEEGATTYEEIVAAHNEGKVVLCYYDNTWVARLEKVQTSQVMLQAYAENSVIKLVCNNKGQWTMASYSNEHGLKPLDNGNVEVKIGARSAEVATPQYVENLLGVIINGEY